MNLDEKREARLRRRRQRERESRASETSEQREALVETEGKRKSSQCCSVCLKSAEETREYLTDAGADPGLSVGDARARNFMCYAHF